MTVELLGDDAALIRVCLMPVNDTMQKRSNPSNTARLHLMNWMGQGQRDENLFYHARYKIIQYLTKRTESRSIFSGESSNVNVDNGSRIIKHGNIKNVLRC